MQPATCAASIPPTETDIGVQVQSSPMHNTVLEEALIDVLKEPFQVHVQQSADKLEQRLYEAKKPFKDVLDAPTPARGAEGRLSYFDRLAAVKKLFTDSASEYEVPPGARTMRVFTHGKKIVLKHFACTTNSSLYDLEDVLLLPPVKPVTPRSEVRVRSNEELVAMSYQGLSFNTKNADHGDIIDAFPSKGSFPTKNRYVIPQQELLNQGLRQELPAPRAYTASELERFASHVRTYLVNRQDETFSVS